MPIGSVISLPSLQTTYFEYVGMNTTLILNVPPATTGQFDAPDVKLLQDFADLVHVALQDKPSSKPAGDGRLNVDQCGFDATKAVDDDICTYWAAASGK